ncbi:hypothetical protein [Cohnella silvisoli]|uniref:Acyltransferase 3 domain-containing protein n=1 Tax=Cohnella silvisoli TaxID=2873699 RepID=A0ABV1KLH5_9BACL|nr:hypothetical protein [Cohnella silvisoli]MCD9020690.1 hypothetical protein [Cohnella silvisoli]
MRETLQRAVAWELVEIRMLNLRFALILLVFLATGIEPIIGRFSGLQAFYNWIYLFHIPLFAFVTGYFARLRC